MQKLKQLCYLLLLFVPRYVPTGMNEFDALIARIKYLCQEVTQNESDIRFAVSTIIMHLGPQIHMKADWFFVKTVRSGAAKQVASEQFRATKQKRDDEIAKLLAEAAANQQPAADTASQPAESVNGTSQEIKKA